MDPITVAAAATITLPILLKIYATATEGVCRSTKSMDGKTVIVTGANTGIGLETARDLAQRKARVILACRNLEKGRKAREDIKNSTGHGDVVLRHLDLSSLSSVRKFANEINTTEPRLDVLIHNAGVAPEPGRHMTEDNLELQFATNHFGPFLLNHLLLDLLKKSAPSRIVIVSSITHLWSSIDLDNLNLEKYERSPYWVYCSTKLANLLFMHELNKRLSETGVTVNALHPGGVQTAIFRDAQWFIKYVFLPLCHFYLKSPKAGAQTSIYLAVAEELQGVSGMYFADCRPAWLRPIARDDKLAAKLWEISEKFTGISSSS